MNNGDIEAIAQALEGKMVPYFRQLENRIAELEKFLTLLEGTGRFARDKADRVLHIIARADQDYGLMLSEISKKTQFMKAGERYEILERLLSNGDIDREVTVTGGRAGQVFRITERGAEKIRGLTAEAHPPTMSPERKARIAALLAPLKR